MPNLLLVDDEPDLLTILRMLYELQGFTVHSARDGEHALEVIAQNPVDIILTDLMMPRLDGLGLSQKLRQTSGHKNIPIILHTAAGVQVPGLGQHYDALIPKPSTLEDQLKVIHALLARKPAGH